MDEVDVVVPRNKISEMVEYMHNLHSEVDIRIKSFGHAGDGNLHAYILKDDLTEEQWQERMTLAMDKIYRKANELSGQVSGEHGIGYAKKPYLNESLEEETMNIMRGIKAAFDPKNILNPHKVCQVFMVLILFYENLLDLCHVESMVVFIRIPLSIQCFCVSYKSFRVHRLTVQLSADQNNFCFLKVRDAVGIGRCKSCL